MSTLTKPYTFASGGYAVASQVNADFDNIYGWINGGGAMWNDGTVAFTTAPSGPATDPTSDNQLARKAYVDSRLTYSLQGAGLVNLSAANGNSLKIVGANSVVNLSATVDVTINFAAWFDNSNPIILASPGATAGALVGIEVAAINLNGARATGFTVRGFNTSGVRIAGNVGINWLAIGT